MPWLPGVLEAPVGGIVNFKDPDGIALSFFWTHPPDAT